MCSCNKETEEDKFLKALKEQEKLYETVMEDKNSVEPSYPETNEDLSSLTPEEYNLYYDDENENTESIEDIKNFDYEAYIEIINDINSIINTNSTRQEIINNLATYETGKYEVLYPLHTAMLKLDEKSRIILRDKIKSDESFDIFLKTASEYAESTLIAYIFQNLIFLAEN